MATAQRHPQDCVTVVVRIRKENDKERGQGHAPVVKKVDTNIVVFDPKVTTSPEMFRGRKRGNRDLNKRESRDAYFAFDYVFDSDSSNADVFERATRPVIDNVLEGYNACGLSQTSRLTILELGTGYFVLYLCFPWNARYIVRFYCFL